MPNQYGFRPDHSTTHALIDLVGQITKSINNKSMALGVFLDLSKAFDSLDIDKLLAKLYHYGVRGKSFDWFSSYLKNRKLFVSYDNSSSQIYEITHGVPQGSVLGPLLYIIYTNDLSFNLKYSNSILFADDSTILCTGKKIKDIIPKITHDLNILIDWFYANKLTLNISKTSCILFKSKTTRINSAEIKLKFGLEKIIVKKTTKFLGFEIDQHLNWDNHIKQLITKINKNLYLLRCFKKLLPNWSKRMLYFNYIHSNLTYGLSVWGPMASQLEKNKLFKLQKKAVRTIENAKQDCPSAPLFKKYKILRFNDLINLEILKTAYNLVHESLPIPLNNLFQQNNFNHQYNTRNAKNPRVAPHKSKVYHSSIFAKLPIAWQNTPNSVKNSNSINKTLLIAHKN